ncbi:MAG: pilus assembly protein PilM, partial [Phycisphaerales bacterium]|nr:pilus assembly protein PilM [Phycisphaerales bacterium]
MPLFTEKFLVIDYGSSYIKGALYESGPGGNHILRLESLPIVSVVDIIGEEDRTEFAEYEYNLVRYVQSFFPEETNFLLNLPLENIYVRDLSVPVVNQKQIEEVIPFEVENLIPVTLDEAEVIGRAWEIGAEDSRVISFAAARENLLRAVSPLRRPQSTIRLLSVDAAGLASFVRSLPPDEYLGRVIAQIDIGGRYTIINGIRDGALVFTRKVPIGGDAITEIVAHVLGIKDPIVAEQKKLSLEIDVSALSARPEKPEQFFRRERIERKDYDRIVKQSQAVIAEISEEVERSVLSLPCEPPAEYYLSGGGSCLKGARDLMESHLKVRLSEYPLALSDGEPVAMWATALGTAGHYDLKPTERLDFLASDFGSQLRGGKFSLGAFFTPLLVLILSFAPLLIGMIVEFKTFQKQGERASQRILELAQSVPAARGERVAARAAQIVAQECERRVLNSAGRAGVLEILKEITDHTPPPGELDFRLKSVTINGPSVDIQGEVALLTEATRLESEFRQSSMFSQVQSPTQSTGGARQAVTFNLQ